MHSAYEQLLTRLSKEHFDVFGDERQNVINDSLNNSMLSNQLKVGERSSLFKYNDCLIMKTTDI